MVWHLRPGGVTLPHSFETKWRTCAQLYSLCELLKIVEVVFRVLQKTRETNARIKNSGKKKRDERCCEVTL